MFTEYASPERSDAETIVSQHNYFIKDKMLNYMLNSMPNIILVLNKNRQIVFANSKLEESLNGRKEEYLGRRPGEVFNCKNANISEGGCGTTKFCSTCGALAAILNSINGISDVQECRITKDSGDALDLRVWTRSIDIDNERFSIFTMWDITDEKRRKMLERIFFHDVLNTAGGIKGFTELLKDASPEEVKEFENIIRGLADKLIDEIQAQRELSLAELNELTVNSVPCYSNTILDEVFYLYFNSEVAKNKQLNVSYDDKSIRFNSDPLLVRRVLGNMTKNALEAIDEGETVTLKTSSDEDTITFSVHNPGVIPEQAQLQIFMRSFSTKGTGRGLGTYSMKLITERYLKGKISYTTSEEEGTTFTVTLKK